MTKQIARKAIRIHLCFYFSSIYMSQKMEKYICQGRGERESFEIELEIFSLILLVSQLNKGCLLIGLEVGKSLKRFSHREK